MIIKNHNNEDVEIESIKRIKGANTTYYFLVKVHTSVGSTEIYPYEDFQEYNPEFNWPQVE